MKRQLNTGNDFGDVHFDDFQMHIKNKSDRFIDYFLIGFFLVGLALCPFYDTWIIGAGVGGLSIITYYSAKFLLKDSSVYQYILGVVLGIFMAQYIYQMHGLFEMHFIAFIASAILITYQKWKLQIPLAAFVIVHHALFGYLQYSGNTKVYFTQLNYMSLQTFIIHGLLATMVFFICGLWAYNFRVYSLRHIRQTNENARLQQEKFEKEAMEKQQEILRHLNEELTQQTEELKASEEELKNQEEELRQINGELEEKTGIIELARAALAVKAGELETSSKYKSEFLANMSHELRTPLNSILILSNLLKENKSVNLNEKQLQYANIIHKSGSDLLTLINDILDLSKIEAGKIDMLFELVTIKEITDDMSQVFGELAKNKKISFITNIDPKLPEKITTDKQRLEQVIKNLLSNAFKFTPESGTVKLVFSIQNENLAISVSDTGIGIPPEKQKLIFEAFQQADGATNRKYGGTGLGLSISKELVKKLFGEIKLSSTPGEGSIFTLFFSLKDIQLPVISPLVSDSENAVDYNLANVVEQHLIPDDKKDINQGEQFILIIEDDTIFANHVKNFATERGYKTIVAISGDEGLFYAKKYAPAAIILDMGLPVIDGQNILKILKSDDKLKNIPVHVFTAGDRDKISTENIRNYYQKPLQDNDLEHAFSDIRTHLQEKYNSILVYTHGNSAIVDIFKNLTSDSKTEISYDLVKTTEDAMKLLKHKKYDCLIADIGDDLPQGIILLQQLKAIVSAETYIITCLEGDISSADEKQLKTYSDSLIRKSPQYANRLFDEIALFLHKIQNPKQAVIPNEFKKEIDKDFEKSLKGKKVLLADDDMRNIFSLTALLEDNEMEVISAENGQEALEMLEQNRDVDIVLMDIMMPVMDGYETMQHIRRNSKFKGLPIIALTAKAMIGDREKCLEAGASDYITKPIDNAKLFSLIRVWISKR